MRILVMLVLVTLGMNTSAQTTNDPLAGWRDGVQIHPVAPEFDGHTIHSYFNTCPESPDGQWVLYFASTTRDAHHGDVCVRHRTSGEQKILARDIHVEDAHRVACQQWAARGKSVVWQGEDTNGWYVAAVDIESGKQRILARDQLAGWGQPDSEEVPLYGLHWRPGEHRGLDLVNVATGTKRTVIAAAEFEKAHADWLKERFADKPVSVFFPIMSPDFERVIFKLATATGDNPRSKHASERLGLIGYSLKEKRFLFIDPRWRHPAWMPDSRHIIQAGCLMFDSNDGSVKSLAKLPRFSGGHPSSCPDGKLLVSDTPMGNYGGVVGDWGVAVLDVQGSDHVFIHRFDQKGGPKSWRKPHPHPVFSADGQRIYFNVSSGRWTKLYVAERATKP